MISKDKERGQPKLPSERLPVEELPARWIAVATTAAVVALLVALLVRLAIPRLVLVTRAELRLVPVRRHAIARVVRRTITVSVGAIVGAFAQTVVVSGLLRDLRAIAVSVAVPVI